MPSRRISFRLIAIGLLSLVLIEICLRLVRSSENPNPQSLNAIDSDTLVDLHAL